MDPADVDYKMFDKLSSGYATDYIYLGTDIGCSERTLVYLNFEQAD